MLGREIFTPDEVRKLDNKKCIIFIRGFDPILDNKYIPFAHPMFDQTADGKGKPYEHQVRKNSNLIGPPYEILSQKAVAHFEKLKKKGENVYIDTLTYEEFMMLGEVELGKRFTTLEEQREKDKLHEEEAPELEYTQEIVEEKQEVQTVRREQPEWEDTITNRMLHWTYSEAQKAEVALAIKAGIPRSIILTYFYPETSVEEMVEWRRKHGA